MLPEQSNNTESIEDDPRATSLMAFEVGGYLTPEQGARATQRLKESPDEFPSTDSARALLDWLIAEGYTTAQAEEKATQSLLDARFANVREQLVLLQLLKDLDPPRFEKRFNELVASVQREKKTKQTLVGLGGLTVALAVGAYLMWPASPPSCGASSTVKTLSMMMIDAGVDMVRKNPMQVLGKNGDTFPEVSNYREIGYDEANRSRGCVADLSVADEHATLGYVIRPNPKDKGGFVVQTFPSEYVKARYSAQGLDSKLGAPLGREAISTAFMAGVAQLDSKTDKPSPEPRLPGDDEPPTLAKSVVGVMPAADCKQIDGDRVSCPLLIDYRDALLDAIGSPSMLQLKSDFTFVKDGGGWKTADDFEKTLMTAIYERRIAKVYGDTVADKTNAQK